MLPHILLAREANTTISLHRGEPAFLYPPQSWFFPTRTSARYAILTEVFQGRRRGTDSLAVARSSHTPSRCPPGYWLIAVESRNRPTTRNRKCRLATEIATQRHYGHKHAFTQL